MTVRVLVNGLHAKSGGGITYLRQVLGPLAADPALDVHLLIHPAQANLFPNPAPGITRHYADFRPGFLGEIAWEQIRLPRLARRLGVDATFSPANFGPLMAPGTVILLRNALAVGALDQRLGKRLYWWALTAMTFLSVLFCRQAMAVSDYARQSLARPTILRRKVTVVHHGVDAHFKNAGPAVRERFLLAVSDLYIQKNLLTLIEAMAMLRDRDPNLILRVAGAAVDPDYAAQIRQRIEALGLQEAIILMGPQDPDALVNLYSRCGVFVFPSTVETFGQPLAEAMAAGAPIACADATAMPEVLADAGLYFDPTDPADMAQTINLLLTDATRADRLGAAAAARGVRFDWRHTAAATSLVLQRAAEGARALPPPHGHSLAAAWVWVAAVSALYGWQFRGIIGPILSRLGIA